MNTLYSQRCTLLVCGLMETVLWSPGTSAAHRHRPNPAKPQPAPHTAEEERNVAEALYRYLLAQARMNSRWKGVQVIFLSWNNKDPHAPLLRCFQDNPLPVKVASASRNGRRWWVEDKVTGQKGVILFVDRIQWSNNAKIQVRGGFGLEGKSGMEATFHMLHQGRQWRVAHTSNEDTN